MGNNNIAWESDTAYNVENKGSRRNACSSSSNLTFSNLPLDVPASVVCTQRYYNPNDIAVRPPYQYQIPVPDNNAYYVVILHLVELVRFVGVIVIIFAVVVVEVLLTTSPPPI